MGFMHYLDLALGKWYRKVMEALAMRDIETIRKHAFKMAFNEHTRLLKRNMPDALYGRRVKTVEELEREYMQGLNLLHAASLAKIFETIREGEVQYYLNLKITKQNGEVKIENVGWKWVEEDEE